MVYLADPVTRMQLALANTVRGGLSDLGDRPLQQSRLDLNKAQTLYNIGRQQEADERDRQVFEAGAPARQLSQLQAKRGIADIQAENALRNKELDAETFARLVFGENPSKETVNQFFANGVPQKILKASGGRFENGKFVKANGQAATGNDLPVLLPIMKDIFELTANPGKHLNQKIRQYEDKYLAGGTGTTAASPEEVRWYEQALKAKSDPNWLINQYEKQNDRAKKQIAYYRNMGMNKAADILQDTINDRNNRIEKVRAALAEKSKRKFELEKLDIQEKGKDRRAGATKFEFTTSDSNAIGRQVQRLFDVNWLEDESVFEGGTQEDRNRAANMQARAEEIYKARGGNLTHAQAVKEAGKEFGLKFKSSEADVNSFIDKQLGRYNDLTGAKEPQTQPKPVAEKGMPLVRGSAKLTNDTVRIDGTKKGPGFLGSLKMKDGSGKTATELSLGVTIDGKNILIPALVPTLTDDEINHLLEGKKVTDAIADKAVAHARDRIRQGYSPFRGENEGWGRGLENLEKRVGAAASKNIKKMADAMKNKPDDIYKGMRGFRR